MTTHPTAPSAVLLGLVIVASVCVGFLLGDHYARAGVHDRVDMRIVPANFVADTTPSGHDSRAASSLSSDQEGTQEVGRLQAEILRLQVLFLRLAEHAGLDDGEFDLEAAPLSSHKPATNETLGLVNQDLVHMSRQGERMMGIFEKRVARYESRISGRPIRNRAISSRFGYRSDPESGKSRLHKGIDFSGNVGDAILAIASGVVTYAGKNGAYGNLVELEHANGYRTRYAHNDEVLVALGAVVKKGQQIATLGSTGRSTGPHLHFEVLQHGKAMDPQYFIR